MKKTITQRRSTSKKTIANTDSAKIFRILNCIPSREMERDWQIEHAMSAGLVAARPIPQSKDLRAPWWDIADQGQTGSCVGWATADSVLRWHFVQAGRLEKNEHLSARYIWMAAKEFDDDTSEATTFIELAGTSLKTALDIARKYGAVKDTLLPFEPPVLYQGKEEVFYATASQLKIASYYNLGRDIDAWRRWIATNEPILTRLDVDATWDNAKATNGKLTKYQPPAEPAGHAVAFVGYDASMFIVRNSWGTIDWGDKGFGYASNAYAAAAFTEAYGVSVT